MLKLLKKELRLAIHPATWMFLGLPAMALIPNYPYAVAVFYSFLGLFFTCLNGRENGDVFYTLLLPVSKRDAVRARMLFALLYQAAFLLLIFLFGILGQKTNPGLNGAGLEPNIAFLGWSLILFAVGNFAFFSVYYKNVKNVGKALIFSAVPIFLLTAVEIAATYAVPFVRDRLDTKDPEFLPAKLIFLAVGLVVYAAGFFFTLRRCEVLFDKQDI